MTGVLQKAAPKPKSNPMLDQIVQQAEAQVPKDLQQQFLTIMTVGGKLMWSDQMIESREEFDRLIQEQADDLPALVTHTVLRVISTIQNESKQEKPLDAVGLAAPIFMAHILQYAESKHGVPVTKEMIDQTGQLLQVNLLKMYGVTEQHVQELMKQRGPTPQTGPALAQSGTEGNAEVGAVVRPPADTDTSEEESEEEEA